MADILRHRPVGGEQRGYPARGKGTRLHLAVDATRTAGPGRSRLATSRPLSGTGLHAWEP
ncbi:hypothetical protein SLA_3519 [Streptomyces laurentii]|uniref:Uncharacterized protein n=1 Tax=Streptomyces laurentii TaxID=39478 RepID=A0A160NZK2_STRLU|nr:hypothetical protein SLA_3519 [Streptomyces laurentii]